MYVYEKYDYSLFESRFRDYKRLNQFTPQGLRALFTFLEEVGPVELDVIALCCEWYEDTIENITKNSNIKDFGELTDNTIAMELDNGNILYHIY